MSISVLVRNEVEPAWLEDTLAASAAEDPLAERHTAERLVLSAAAHQALTAELPSSGGDVRFEHLAMAGHVMLHPGSEPGSVRVTVDFRDGGGSGAASGLSLEADVRRSWLRSVCADSLDSPEGVARIVRALGEIAALPHQTTVQVFTGPR